MNYLWPFGLKKRNFLFEKDTLIQLELITALLKISRVNMLSKTASSRKGKTFPLLA